MMTNPKNIKKRIQQIDRAIELNWILTEDTTGVVDIEAIKTTVDELLDRRNELSGMLKELEKSGENQGERGENWCEKEKSVRDTRPTEKSVK